MNTDHTRIIRTVYIRKKFEPLVIEDYEQSSPANSRQKLKLEATRWEQYMERRDLFLKLWERVRQHYLEDQSCPEELMLQYRDAKAAFYILHLTLNEEFSKYAI